MLTQVVLYRGSYRFWMPLRSASARGVQNRRPSRAGVWGIGSVNWLWRGGNPRTCFYPSGQCQSLTLRASLPAYGIKKKFFCSMHSVEVIIVYKPIKCEAEGWAGQTFIPKYYINSALCLALGQTRGECDYRVWFCPVLVQCSTKI